MHVEADLALLLDSLAVGGVGRRVFAVGLGVLVGVLALLGLAALAIAVGDGDLLGPGIEISVVRRYILVTILNY